MTSDKIHLRRDLDYYGNHKTQPINARHLTPLTKPGKKCDNATGQGYSYSLWSQELQFTFVNCLQIIHKFKHEHEKEYSLHVIGAVGPLTMSCTA